MEEDNGILTKDGDNGVLMLDGPGLVKEVLGVAGLAFCRFSLFGLRDWSFKRSIAQLTAFFGTDRSEFGPIFRSLRGLELFFFSRDSTYRSSSVFKNRSHLVLLHGNERFTRVVSSSLSVSSLVMYFSLSDCMTETSWPVAYFFRLSYSCLKMNDKAAIYRPV